MVVWVGRVNYILRTVCGDRVWVSYISVSNHRANITPPAVTTGEDKVLLRVWIIYRPHGSNHAVICGSQAVPGHTIVLAVPRIRVWFCLQHEQHIRFRAVSLNKIDQSLLGVRVNIRVGRLVPIQSGIVVSEDDVHVVLLGQPLVLVKYTQVCGIVGDHRSRGKAMGNQVGMPHTSKVRDGQPFVAHIWVDPLISQDIDTPQFNTLVGIGSNDLTV
jgi:hypothetical protein